MHPTLAKVLASWKLEHWERIYGRAPTDDDLVVPARTMEPVAVEKAAKGMKADLKALKVRVEAGKHRSRGGHDLRAWYQTRCIEDGGDSLIIRATTHARDRSVNGGYERFAWATVCREVAKLRVTLLGGDVLALDLSTAREESAESLEKTGEGRRARTLPRRPVKPMSHVALQSSR